MTDFKFNSYEKSVIAVLEQVVNSFPVLVLGSAYYNDNESFKKFQTEFYNLAQNIRQSYVKRYTDNNTKEFTEYLRNFNEAFDKILNLKEEKN